MNTKYFCFVFIETRPNIFKYIHTNNTINTHTHTIKKITFDYKIWIKRERDKIDLTDTINLYIFLKQKCLIYFNDLRIKTYLSLMRRSFQ